MTEVLFGISIISVLVAALTALITFVRQVLAPRTPVELKVNDTLEIKGFTGEKLLTALHNADIAVPSACAGAGTCGLCRVGVEGAGPVLPTEAGVLSPRDIREGQRLACQVTIRNAIDVTVPQEMIAAESVTCTVASNTSLTPFIRELVLQFPEGAWPLVTAGDYIQLAAPAYQLDFDTINVPRDHTEDWKSARSLSVSSNEPVTRAYSISNRLEDTEAGRIVLNIRLALPPPSVPDAPPGIVSSWLFALDPGDAVEVTGPFGSFRAQPTDREMVFIGGGVGMAPLRAIILEQLQVHKTDRKMSYWYGARSRGELFYVDEMDTLAKAHDNFKWVSALSQPRAEDDWNGPVGFIHEVALREHLESHPAPEECEYYLCGPPMMMKAVMSMLDDLGVERDSIFMDDFGV